MKHSRLPVATVAVTILYCCICFASSGCILYGSYCELYNVFHFGNSLVYFWLFNPIAIILACIGLIQRHKARGIFILCAVMSTICWLIAGVMLATVF